MAHTFHALENVFHQPGNNSDGVEHIDARIENKFEKLENYFHALENKFHTMENIFHQIKLCTFDLRKSPREFENNAAASINTSFSGEPPSSME